MFDNRGSRPRRSEAGAPGTTRETLAPLRTKGPVRKVTTSSGFRRGNPRGRCRRRFPSRKENFQRGRSHKFKTVSQMPWLFMCRLLVTGPLRRRTPTIGNRRGLELEKSAHPNPQLAWPFPAHLSPARHQRFPVRPPMSTPDDPKPWLARRAAFTIRSSSNGRRSPRDVPEALNLILSRASLLLV